MKQIYPPQNTMSPLENPNPFFPGPEKSPESTNVEKMPPYPNFEDMSPEQRAALREVIEMAIESKEREGENQ